MKLERDLSSPERGCPPWCIERHPADAGPDRQDWEIWLHRSAATQVDTVPDRSVLRSEWTAGVVEVYLTTADDRGDDIRYAAAIEVAHGGVQLTVTADEARNLASALEHCADQVDSGRTRSRLRMP